MKKTKTKVAIRQTNTYATSGKRTQRSLLFTLLYRPWLTFRQVAGSVIFGGDAYTLSCTDLVSTSQMETESDVLRAERELDGY